MSAALAAERIAAIKDVSFRNRFVHEHGTISAWCSKLRAGATVLAYGCGQGMGSLGCAVQVPVTELRNELVASGFKVERVATPASEQQPPPSLLEIYREEVLCTATVYLLATRSQ